MCVALVASLPCRTLLLPHALLPSPCPSTSLALLLVPGLLVVRMACPAVSVFVVMPCE